VKYLGKTFTLPAAPAKVTKERWEEIFGKPEPKKKIRKKKG